MDIFILIIENLIDIFNIFKSIFQGERLILVGDKVGNPTNSIGIINNNIEITHMGGRGRIISPSPEPIEQTIEEILQEVQEDFEKIDLVAWNLKCKSELITVRGYQKDDEGNITETVNPYFLSKEDANLVHESVPNSTWIDNPNVVRCSVRTPMEIYSSPIYGNQPIDEVCEYQYGIRNDFNVPVNNKEEADLISIRDNVLDGCPETEINQHSKMEYIPKNNTLVISIKGDKLEEDVLRPGLNRNSQEIIMSNLNNISDEDTVKSRSTLFKGFVDLNYRGSWEDAKSFTLDENSEQEHVEFIKKLKEGAYKSNNLCCFIL